ncbi:MAG TPA: bifunctional methylenetetrahydrofolate dehydrogenase/methenyltetrahydrofolate cyclohydrolase FolD [Wenzhouxiangella sp.]
MTTNLSQSTAQLLDGRAVADGMIGAMAKVVQSHVANGGRVPGLAVVLVGDDPASEVYVSHKVRACERVGIHSTAHRLPATVSESELLSLIDSLNADDSIHGILVQLPLPTGLDASKVTHHIVPEKDVDGFHPTNMGLLAQRTPAIRPCTPKGIITLLHHYGLDPKSKDALVVGASNIVGRPLMLELLLAGATVTIAHRFTTNLETHVRRADLLCVAVGRPDLIDPNWIKEGAIVVDVGINRGADGKIRGDLDFNAVCQRASWVTPVPGGIGPMTVATLLQNTIEAAHMVIPGVTKTPGVR